MTAFGSACFARFHSFYLGILKMNEFNQIVNKQLQSLKKKYEIELIHFKILDQYDFEETFNFIQKAFLKHFSYSWKYLNFRKQHKKYIIYFLEAMNDLFRNIHSSYPTFRFSRTGLEKLFNDYFKILASNYKERGINNFYLKQVKGEFAIQLFHSKICKKYQIFDNPLSEYYKSLALDDFDGHNLQEDESLYSVYIGGREYRMNEEKQKQFFDDMTIVDKKIAVMFEDKQDTFIRKQKTTIIEFNTYVDDEKRNRLIRKYAAARRYLTLIKYFKPYDCAKEVGFESLANHDEQWIKSKMKDIYRKCMEDK